MSDERAYDIDIPAISIPEARVYAHSTRMSDFATPDVERIVKPETELRRHVVEIRLVDGDSKTNVENHPEPSSPLDRLKYRVKRSLHRREPVIDLGKRFALDMRFSFTGNFAHLIHDVLGPLRLIEQTLEQDSTVESSPIHVILPKKAPEIALRVLEFAGVPTICTDGTVRGRLVSITQELNICLLPHLVRQPMDTWTAPTPDRVFVSRRGARSILNENSVTNFLVSEGFERVYMEDLPIGQQWSMLGNASEVVGIHGAGLASLGFSTHRSHGVGPRFRLIELFSPGFASSCFRDYAAVLGGSWVGVRGKITPEVVRDLDFLDQERAHENASFEVDLDSLAEALKYARSGS